MASASDYLENSLLAHSLGITSMTAPTTVYLALFTANTGLEGNSPSAEISTSGTAYTRKAISFGSVSGGSVSSNADVTFDEATASWGTVTHCAIVDHATNTTWGTNVNVLYWGALSASKTISTNDTFIVQSGDLTVSLD